MNSNFALEEDYPYLGQNDYCKQEKFTFNKYKINKVCKVPMNDVDQLKQALQSGPVSVTIDVPESLTFYVSGIYNDKACLSEFSQLDHAVVAVGYGEDDEAGPYWIIRNSWSSEWGQDGYIYISAKDNICGVLTDSSYAVFERNPEYVE